MKRCLAVLLVAALSALGGQVYAHHSFAATYLDDETVTIEGELVQFLYRNPHSFVHLLVRENGALVRYAVEWRGAGQLSGQGVTGETLKAGDHLVIRGTPGSHPDDHRLFLISLHRPSDGFGWSDRHQVGMR